MYASHLVWGTVFVRGEGIQILPIGSLLRGTPEAGQICASVTQKSLLSMSAYCSTDRPCPPSQFVLYAIDAASDAQRLGREFLFDLQDITLYYGEDVSGRQSFQEIVNPRRL